MKLEEAQKDMQLAYVSGGSGVLTSGMVWIFSGIVAFYVTKQTSITVFFFGGMLIHPIGIMISKLFNRTGKHQKNNPLAKLALESTAILLIGIFIAFAVFQIESEWFYPIMLMIIGGRYLIFQSIYGMKLYWVLGLILVTTGIMCLITSQAFNFSAIVGGVIEMVFGITIIQMDRNSN